MRKMVGTLVALSSMVMACAADDAPEQTAVAEAPAASEIATETPVGAAFFGLTVIDCQDEATDCFEKKGDHCAAQLTDCLADITLQVAKDKVHEAGATVQCGTDGLTCFSGVGEIQAAVACQQKVEDCVIDRVHAVAGVKLPHTRRILGLAGDIIHAAVDIVEPVVDTAVGVVGNTVDVAGTVVGKTVEVAGTVVGKTVDAAGNIIGATVDAAGSVVGKTVDAAGNVIGTTVGVAADVVGGTIDAADNLLGGVLNVAECSLASSRCWRESRDYDACRAEYRKCLKR